MNEDNYIAAMDQLEQSIKDGIRLVKKNYDACIANGFTRDQAMILTIEFYRSTVLGSK